MSAKLRGLFSVADKVAVVTGGTSGIGKLIASSLVDAGARVYVISRKEDACAKTADELSAGGGECVGFPADLADDGADRIAAMLAAKEEKLHLLVNNAGTTWGAPLEDYPGSAFRKVLNLNVVAPFELTTAVLPQLRAAATTDDPSRVINISSAEGTIVPDWENYAYPASKAALNHLTRHLARRLASESITVNSLAAGLFPIGSRMLSFASQDDAQWNELLGKVPLGRAGDGLDIAGAAVFLCSRASAYLTGAVIPVDGGFSGAGYAHDFAGSSE